jgi:phenylpropionate dioxygenase-like ring-hydroxylating dioxygenase large terminal subunit
MVKRMCPARSGGVFNDGTGYLQAGGHSRMNVPHANASPLLADCPPSLPAKAYYDDQWFDRERAAIWARNWVYAGRTSTFAPRTIRKIDVAGESVIVACDDAGTLKAYHNTCRHRGAELCSAQEQDYNGRLIRCPYHAWAYDNDGALVSTGYATPTPDFDKAQHGLFPVALRHWNGFVFLCLADTPPPFEPDMGMAALDNWPMDRLVTGHVLETQLACNWKIFWENYNECLHCPGIHPGLSDRVPIYRKGIMSDEEDPAWSPDQGHRAALKDGARSWTSNGHPCGPEFPDLSRRERDIAHNFVTVYPSIYVVAHVDYVRAVSMIPLSPEITQLRAEWLFLPETLAQPDFDLANVTGFATTVLQEDGAACEMNQRGLKSYRFEQGRLMPQEFEIHAFHQWVMARLNA